MSSQATLRVERRSQAGKGVARKLRAAGKVPAIVYGGDDEAMAISLDAHDTMHLFQSISVDNTIIHLEVEGHGAPLPTLVRDVQAHPYKPELLHVDFFRIQKGVEVELDVPVVLEGTPTGVKDKGGVLEQTLYSLPVRCIPSAIPESFIASVEALDIGDSLQVGGFEVPEGVTVLLEPDQTICSVQAPSVAQVADDEDESGEAEGPGVTGADMDASETGGEPTA